MAYTSIPAAGAKLRGSILSSLITETRSLWAEVGSDHALATSDTTLENITDLVIAVAANTKYLFNLCVVAVNAAGSTEDIKVGMSFPAGATCDFGGAAPAAGVTSSSGDGEWLRRLAATSGSTANGYGAVVTNPLNLMLTVRLSTGANAGNLQIMAAQNTSGGNATTVKAGSYLQGLQVV
jgi:hypothetical protein